MILCHLEVTVALPVPFPGINDAGTVKPVNGKVFDNIVVPVVFYAVRSCQDDSPAALVLCISSFNEGTDLVKSASHFSSRAAARVRESLAVR